MSAAQVQVTMVSLTFEEVQDLVLGDVGAGGDIRGC